MHMGTPLSRSSRKRVLYGGPGLCIQKVQEVQKVVNSIDNSSTMASEHTNARLRYYDKICTAVAEP